MNIMKNKIFILLVVSNLLLSHEIYKEIRVYNDSYLDKTMLNANRSNIIKFFIIINFQELSSLLI